MLDSNFYHPWPSTKLAEANGAWSQATSEGHSCSIMFVGSKSWTHFLINLHSSWTLERNYSAMVPAMQGVWLDGPPGPPPNSTILWKSIVFWQFIPLENMLTPFNLGSEGKVTADSFAIENSKSFIWLPSHLLIMKMGILMSLHHVFLGHAVSGNGERNGEKFP